MKWPMAGHNHRILHRGKTVVDKDNNPNFIMLHGKSNMRLLVTRDIGITNPNLYNSSILMSLPRGSHS